MIPMKWLLRNLRTFVLAFTLAVLVWISAVNTSDPTVTRDYPRSIKLEVVGLDPSLVVVGDLPDTITVSMMAPVSVWDKMTQEKGEVRAILDLSGMTAGKHSIKIQPQVTFRPIQIVSLSVSRVSLALEELGTAKLPVAVVLRGEPAVGYKTGIAQLELDQVNITGPKSVIDRVGKAQVEIGIAGLRQDIQQELNVVVLDANGRKLEGLNITPSKINVTQPIIQLGGYRDIAVKVNISGQQAGGYRVTNISVFPPVVTVYSQNPALIADMPGYVETEPFSLNGESADLNASIPLVLPAGVTVIGEQTVKVQVGISAIEGSLTLKGLPVEIIGLASGLFAQYSPTTVDLIITGPIPLLDSLKTGDVKIVVDLTGLKIGKHTLDPQVQILLSEVKEQSVNPGTIEVTITAAGAFTPAP